MNGDNQNKHALTRFIVERVDRTAPTFANQTFDQTT